VAQERRGSDRLRLVVGAGAGLSTYTLTQVGDFVDVSRRVQFTDDLASSGRGVTSYALLGVEAPVARGIMVRSDVRRLFGSAATNGDFGEFDGLDLSGTRFSMGVMLWPGAWRPSRR
jgi:hypothetical protein